MSPFQFLTGHFSPPNPKLVNDVVWDDCSGCLGLPLVPDGQALLQLSGRNEIVNLWIHQHFPAHFNVIGGSTASTSPLLLLIGVGPQHRVTADRRRSQGASTAGRSGDLCCDSSGYCADGCDGIFFEDAARRVSFRFLMAWAPSCDRRGRSEGCARSRVGLRGTPRRGLPFAARNPSNFREGQARPARLYPSPACRTPESMP